MLNLKYLFLYIGFVSNVVAAQNVIIDSLFFEETQSYRTYKVWVPAEYDTSKTYQTIYCFDADFLFNILSANVEIYADAFIGKMPPTILVGIFFDQRNDDMGIDWNKGVLNKKGRAFMDLVEKNLVPTISKKYNVSEYRTVVGHSNSTTFAHFFLTGDSPLFSGYLTLSQFKLSTDVQRFSELKKALKMNVDMVMVTGELDADYRVKSGGILDSLLDSLAISNLRHTHISMPNADHLTIVPQGVPHALEALYMTYGKRIESKDIIESGCLKNQTPIEVVDSLILAQVGKYGVDLNYRVEDLDLLFELFVAVKDSVGVLDATIIYADLMQDSSEYFYEAQCLEMMGAYRSAEESYLKHLGYCAYTGYWSYIRLTWLYANKLNDGMAAINWCTAGLNRLGDIRFVRQLLLIGKKNPETIVNCIAALEQSDIISSSIELRLAVRTGLAELHRENGNHKKADFYENLIH
ncbi:MAG: putative alpha/beta superfamily hydrolase [Crocinitomix sp.]|jgi:predicted alpha/beta superfamily hydrolase